MDILFTISEASDAFDKIETKLRNFGYVFDSSNIEHHKDKAGKDKYIKEYKIKQLDAEYIKDLAPELKISITAYMDDDDDNKIYHLDATIGYAIWSVSDTNLQSVIDNYLSAAYSDIIDFYIEADYIDFVSDENLDTKSNESLMNNIDLNSLYKQIKESNDSDSLEDLNAKVDTILDALGLVSDDENDTVDDKEDVDNIDINVSTEDDEDDNNSISITEEEESTDDVDNIDNI